MPGAVESFERVAALYDAYVLSTSPWENPSAWSDKLLWVQRHLGAPAYKRLILSHHKNLNAGDYLIDDAPRTASIGSAERTFTSARRSFLTGKPSWRSSRKRFPASVPTLEQLHCQVDISTQRTAVALSVHVFGITKPAGRVGFEPIAVYDADVAGAWARTCTCTSKSGSGLRMERILHGQDEY